MTHDPAGQQPEVAVAEESSVSTSAQNLRDDACTAMAGGLAGAIARGESARGRWVEDNGVVPAHVVAAAWHMTLEDLRQIVARGDVVAIDVRGRGYFPVEFAQLNCRDVMTITRQIAVLDASSQFVFWKRRHGALRGLTILEALTSGSTPSRQVVEFARHLVAQHSAEPSTGLDLKGLALQEHVSFEGELWEFKRRNQQRDMDDMAAGQLTQDQLSWISGGKTREFRIKDSQY